MTDDQENQVLGSSFRVLCALCASARDSLPISTLCFPFSAFSPRPHPISAFNFPLSAFSPPLPISAFCFPPVFQSQLHSLDFNFQLSAFRFSPLPLPISAFSFPLSAFSSPPPYTEKTADTRLPLRSYPTAGVRPQTVITYCLPSSAAHPQIRSPPITAPD
jgi:hypothetical protein